jgi:hypothetical protein
VSRRCAGTARANGQFRLPRLRVRKEEEEESYIH